MHIAECQEPFWRLKMAAATSTCGSVGQATPRSPINPQRLFREMQQQRMNPQGERYLQTNYSIRQVLWEDAFKTWFHGIG